MLKGAQRRADRGRDQSHPDPAGVTRALGETRRSDDNDDDRDRRRYAGAARAAARIVEAAVEFAKAGTDLEPANALRHVYADGQ